MRCARGISEETEAPRLRRVDGSKDQMKTQHVAVICILPCDGVRFILVRSYPDCVHDEGLRATHEQGLG